jgi:SAM-dependent methyltransferase
MTRRNRFAAGVSALTYRWTYLRVVDEVDADLFAFLGDRLRGAHVIDCGCGPGITSEKLLRAGARSLLAVDGAASMVRQARARLAGFGTARVRHAYVDATFLRGPVQRPDIVLFKRSLYAGGTAAVETLRAAVDAVGTGGMVVVVHPERSLLPYAFGRPARLRRHTAYHLLNRVVSRAAARLGLGEYRVYTRAELIELARGAARAEDEVVAAPVTQDAYNIVAIVVRECLRGDAASG